MDSLYSFPKQSKFGRILPKNKIYEHSSATSRVKDLFIREVGKIIWSYKLSPSTLNIPESDRVNEIQVFTIVLRTGILNHEVLKTIDKAIPSPILFVLNYENNIRYVAAYKRPSDADREKWVVSDYFETNWVPNDSKHVELPIVLNMGVLYQTFIKKIISLPFRNNETLDEIILRIETMRIKEREAKRVQSRLKKEKQFNRKVDFNAKLKHLNQEIEKLKV
jgi:hypothetical protein